MLVHEDQEKLDEKKEIRLLNLHKTRQKKYENKIKGNKTQQNFKKDSFS